MASEFHFSLRGGRGGKGGGEGVVKRSGCGLVVVGEGGGGGGRGWGLVDALSCLSYDRWYES